MTRTEFTLIESRQKLNSLAVLPALEINGTQLIRVNFTKSLGVLIIKITIFSLVIGLKKLLFSTNLLAKLLPDSL